MTKIQQWVALAVLAVVGVLATGWALLVQPQRSAAAELRTSAQEQVQANARTTTQLAVLEAQARALPEQRERLARVSTKIPDGPALPALVRQLTKASKASGVEFVSLVPGTPVPLGAGGAGGASQLQSLPVTINIVGGYYDVEQYLAALERLPRALRVVNVTLAPGSNPVAPPRAAGTAALSDGSQLTATVTGSVYLTSGEAAPAAGVPLTTPPTPAGAPAPAAQ